MLSTLTFEKITIPAADLGPENSLPSIAKLSGAGEQFVSKLDEEDGLYVGWGMQDDIFPYRMQDLYNRERTDREFEVAVLENEHLKATFCPALGGKMLSLFDKDNNKELLFRNEVFQPCNLALRNAWTSGGVEWNIGMVGHTPFTCSQMFTATLEDEDGTPILRMYEFERIRRVTYQMDFYIPPKSKLLHCRMRIVNPNNTVVPMYWWSNMAVPTSDKTRIVAPASSAYTSDIDDNVRTVFKLPIPICENIDVTYPPRNENEPARDYFYRTYDDRPRYVSYVNEEGYGLMQTSTSVLKGRKLFVWGQNPGARHWQDFLSIPGRGNYVEIQAGLCRSQYEHIPMPPNTAWEWIEVYGALKCNPKKAHGEFSAAQREVEKCLKKAVNIDELERELVETKKRFALSPAKAVKNGTAWGQLENILNVSRGGKPITEHLDFGAVGDEQKAWVSLIENGTVGEHDVSAVPESWIMEPEFVEMLEISTASKDKDNWYAWLQLGTMYLVMGEYAKSEKALKTSCKCDDNCWAHYCLGILSLKNGDKAAAKKHALASLKLKNDDVSLCKATLSVLNQADEHKNVIKFYESFSEDIKANSRARLEYIVALYKNGDYEKALDIFNENGGFILVDVKEGEVVLSDVYARCYKAVAEKNGETVTEVEIPVGIDFRMKADKVKV